MLRLKQYTEPTDSDKVGDHSTTHTPEAHSIRCDSLTLARTAAKGANASPRLRSKSTKSFKNEAKSAAAEEEEEEEDSIEWPTFWHWWQVAGLLPRFSITADCRRCTTAATASSPYSSRNRLTSLSRSEPYLLLQGYQRDVRRRGRKEIRDLFQAVDSDGSGMMVRARPRCVVCCAQIAPSRFFRRHSRRFCIVCLAVFASSRAPPSWLTTMSLLSAHLTRVVAGCCGNPPGQSPADAAREGAREEVPVAAP